MSVKFLDLSNSYYKIEESKDIKGAIVKTLYTNFNVLMPNPMYQLNYRNSV